MSIAEKAVIDLASTAALMVGLVDLAGRLRKRGLFVASDQIASLGLALQRLGTVTAKSLRLSARATLCTDRESLLILDQVLEDWWSSRLEHPALSMRITSTSPAADAPRDGGDDAETANQEFLARASDRERLQHRDVAQLEAEDRRAIDHLIDRLRPPIAARPSMRTVRAARGEVDLRRTVRTALRNGGEIVTLERTRHRIRPRRRVLLVDVSGSMAPWSNTCLRFAFALLSGAPHATEVFTLGTRLTRLTRIWQTRDPGRAMRLAAEAVPDWQGGTLLATQLQAFLEGRGRKGVARGAVVTVLSDGWEADDGRRLGEQMQRLYRLSHTTIWSNPHRSSAGYQPIARGIRQVLPSIDHFVGGCTLAEFEQLAALIERAGSSRRHQVSNPFRRDAVTLR